MVAISKGWLLSEKKNENGKKKQTGGRGEGLRIRKFQGQSKKVKSFSGIAHSLLISLGNFELHFWLCQPQTRKKIVV